jgi:hypothetical protein
MNERYCPIHLELQDLAGSSQLKMGSGTQRVKDSE